VDWPRCAAEVGIDECDTSERRRRLFDDDIDHAVKEAAYLPGASTSGGPCDDGKTDDGGHQQDERVLGGGLPTLVAHVAT
jgi:hypothetical protein